MMLPAVTMEDDAAALCGMLSHRHDDACYDEDGRLICGLSEHEHDMLCFVRRTEISPYDCGHCYEHTHTKDCYIGDKLVCTMTEHTHTDYCLPAAERLSRYIKTEAEGILAAIIPGDPVSLQNAYTSVNALYVPVDDAYYHGTGRDAVGDDDYEMLCASVADYVGRIDGVWKVAAAGLPLRSLAKAPPSGDPLGGPLGGGLLGGGIETANFKEDYDKPENQGNNWQIIGYREYGLDSQYVLLPNDLPGTPAGTIPELRMKKTILPTSVENEFYIALDIEPVVKHNWQATFRNADLIINNAHNSLDVEYHINRELPIETNQSYMGVSSQGSYLLEQSETFTSNDSTQPATKNWRRVDTLKMELSPGNIKEFDVSLMFSLSTVSGLSFYYSAGGRTYKSREVSYQATNNILTVPSATYQDMLNHGFDFFEYMLDYTSLNVSMPGGETMTYEDPETGEVSVLAKTIVDYMNDHITFLGFESYSGDHAVYNATDNSIEWSLEGVQPFYDETLEPNPYVKVYEDTNNMYYVQANAYQMIYRVRLETLTDGFISSAAANMGSSTNNYSVNSSTGVVTYTDQNSRYNATPADARYATNDDPANGDYTHLSYVKPETGQVVEARFDSPVVRGALYSMRVVKEDKVSGEPLPDAEFRLARVERDEDGIETGEVPVSVYQTGSVEDGTNYYYYNNSSGATSAVLVTGDDGSFYVRGLPAGTYKVYETKSPKGYAVIGNGVRYVELQYTTYEREGYPVYTVDTLTASATGNQFKLMTDPVIDNITFSYVLDLLKIDAKDGAPMEDVKFSLYEAETDPVTGERTETLIDAMADTDAYGKTGTTSGLTLEAGAHYVLREIETPDGYQPQTDPLEFWLGFGTDGAPVVQTETGTSIAYFDEKVTTGKMVVKANLARPYGMVKNASFTLTPISGQSDPATEAQTVLTNDDGDAVFNAVPCTYVDAADDNKEKPCHYRLVQTVLGSQEADSIFDACEIWWADDGTGHEKMFCEFDANADSGFLTVSTSAAVSKFHVTAANVTGPKFPHTGGTTELPYVISGCCLMTAPVIYWYALRRKRERRNAN